MRKLLNVLYVTTQGAYLSRDGETVLVRVGEENRLRVPVHTLEGLVCFGQVSCSPFLLHLCAQHKVAVSFLTEHGRFQARVVGPISGNVLLRREQYRRADREADAATVARALVLAKIANCRAGLLRSARERPEGAEACLLQGAAARLLGVLARVEKAAAVDAIRGLEGEAANVYFDAFDAMITAPKPAFGFRGRNRRPPLDNVNALLSFFYTLLVHDVVGALESVGLDPAVGFLHCDRPGRPSLALDLAEEFRPFLADRLALTLMNRRQVNADGFVKSEAGGVWMTDDTRKEVIAAWQKRKQDEILHPFLEERIAIGLLPYVQALLLARHLRGDLDAYPAFFSR